MNFPPATIPFKPLEAFRRSVLPTGPVNTRLSPADQAGVVYRIKPGSPADAATVGAAGTDPAAAQHQRLTQQAQKWVAQTFYGTLMKQMRDSPFKSDLFEGGRGGQAFASLYDQKLIEHMSRGAGKSLVNAIVRKIEAKGAKSAYDKQKKQVTPAEGAAKPDGRQGLGDAADLNARAFGRGSLPGSGDGINHGNGDDEANPFKNVRINVPSAFGS